MTSSRHAARHEASFPRLYGPWALITGAAAGLGAEFARQIVARGVNVVLIDMDAEGLARTADEIRIGCGGEVRVVCTDLTTADFIPALQSAVGDLDIGLVVNNAGISAVGLFIERPLSDHLKVAELNVRAPLMLAHTFAPRLVARGRGGMIFVSSLSALQGTAYVANYAASKAWNLIFAEGLWEELRGQGVDVLGYLVGTTRTPGLDYSKARLDRAGFVPVMNVEKTVQEALAALGKNPSSIAGRVNRLITPLLSRLLPRAWAVRLVSRTTRALYGTP